MDQEISKQLAELKKFIMEHMPTKAELQNLRSELADKNDMDKLYNALDGYAKETRNFNDEKDILKHKVDRMEEWVKEVPNKVGVKYEA